MNEETPADWRPQQQGPTQKNTDTGARLTETFKEQKTYQQLGKLQKQIEITRVQYTDVNT